MQATLPDVVRAHQQGIGRSAYKRLMPVNKTVIRIDDKYELRYVLDCFGRSDRYIWTAWYVGGKAPLRLYDVHGSTVPEEVSGDLAALRCGL